MTEYNKYVITVNRIFENIEKIKAGWNSKDNYNHIELINEYKKILIESANQFDQNKVVNNTQLEKLED